ncbi:50S ribosomal protein L18 [Candidatus Microgenomates bacterium]|nr:50S ribosomal protein L18 [Candidatus Microgenomates bacterium]
MTKKELHVVRSKRVRAKVKIGNLPRLSVFRSNRYVFAQVIDPQKGKTLIAVSSAKVPGREKLTKRDAASKVGELIAQQALDKKIKHVVFDRGPYKYHGIVAAVAEGARKGGLQL